MHIVTLLLFIASLHQVNAIASLGNGLLKGNQKVTDKVRRFCRSYPDMCKGFFKMVSVRNAKREKRNRIMNRYGVVNEVETNKNSYKLRATLPSDHQVSCKFSEKANRLVSKIADDVSNKDGIGRHAVISNIKRYIKDMILLPKSNVVCMNNNGNRAANFIDDNFVSSDTTPHKTGIDSLKEIQSELTSDRNNKKNQHQRKKSKKKFVKNKNTNDPQKKVNFVKKLLNLFVDVALNEKKAQKRVIPQKMVKAKAGLSLDEFEDNLKKTFMFAAGKGSHPNNQHKTEEENTLDRFVDALRNVRSLDEGYNGT